MIATGTLSVGAPHASLQRARLPRASLDRFHQPGRRAVMLELLLNAALPYGGLLLLRHAGVSEPRALLACALVPAGIVATGFVRRGRINGLSALVLCATGLVLLASLLSGSALFVLVQPSFVTGGLALGFIASLAWPRPILFYLARDTICATAEAAGGFEARWSNPAVRRTMRRLTVVWAGFLGAEALFRLALVSIWPSPDLVAATQLLWIVLPMLLVRWSIRAGRRWGSAALV